MMTISINQVCIAIEIVTDALLEELDDTEPFDDHPMDEVRSTLMDMLEYLEREEDGWPE